MTEAADLAEELLAQAAAGDETALAQLFTRYRKRLKHMVRLRLNRRLQGRIDDSDILQEAYLEAARRLPEYLAKKPLPFFLWLRRLTGEKLIDAHRRHLGAKMRDAGQEVSLHRGPMPAASSASLAAQLTTWTRSTARSSPCAILNNSVIPRWPKRWGSMNQPPAAVTCGR